jgi:hypothetical protein
MEELEGSEDEIDIGELDKHNKDEIPDKDPMQVTKAGFLNLSKIKDLGTS